MLRIIPDEGIRARTQAMLQVIPEDKRASVVQIVRTYADDMDACYRELRHSLEETLGEHAEVIIKELNKPKSDWDRSVADRIEGKT